MIINRIAMLAVMYGGTLMLAGLLGGSTELLSGDVPLWLCGSGVALIYSAIIMVASRSLWRMDE